MIGNEAGDTVSGNQIFNNVITNSTGLPTEGIPGQAIHDLYGGKPGSGNSFYDNILDGNPGGIGPLTAVDHYDNTSANPRLSDPVEHDYTPLPASPAANWGIWSGARSVTSHRSACPRPSAPDTARATGPTRHVGRDHVAKLADQASANRRLARCAQHQHREQLQVLPGAAPGVERHAAARFRPTVHGRHPVDVGDPPAGAFEFKVDEVLLADAQPAGIATDRRTAPVRISAPGAGIGLTLYRR